MSSGTTEGLDGDIEYEPFIPTNPTIEQPTVEMSPGGPSEPLPPPPPTQPVPAPKGRGTKRAALLGGVAGAVIAALVVGGVAITRDGELVDVRLPRRSRQPRRPSRRAGRLARPVPDRNPRRRRARPSPDGT